MRQVKKYLFNKNKDKQHYYNKNNQAKWDIGTKPNYANQMLAEG